MHKNYHFNQILADWDYYAIGNIVVPGEIGGFTAFPKVMNRLVKTALDDKERAYARNDASKTIINYVLEKEKMEIYGAKMELLENKVAALEGSKIIVDVDPQP